MYKIVAVDLDETLLDKDKKVCEKNLQAIKKAQALGVKIVPASGRTPGFLGTTLEELDIIKKEEYCILGNGAIIVENENNKIIHCDHIPFSLVERLYQFALHQNTNLGIQIFTPEKVYFYHIDDTYWEHMLTLGPNNERRFDDFIEDLKDKTIIKMLYQKPDMDYLKQLGKEMNVLFGNEISISYSSGRYLEINLLGTDKGVGIHRLAKHLGIDIKDTIAAGDNYNDLAMIEAAGLGCAVANAIPEIKAVSNYVCEKDHNEGAIAEILEKFILK